MYSKFEDHKSNTMKQIHEAKGEKSKNATVKVARISVVRAMGKSLLQNLRDTPTGELNKALDTTEAHLEDILHELEHTS